MEGVADEVYGDVGVDQGGVLVSRGVVGCDTGEGRGMKSCPYCGKDLDPAGVESDMKCIWCGVLWVGMSSGYTVYLWNGYMWGNYVPSGCLLVMGEV